MTDRDSLDLNIGRWLWLGLLAVVAVIVLVVFLANILPGGDDDGDTTSAEQVEWSIVASEYTPNPGEVELKGDEPFGVPTETWLNGLLLARTAGGSFDWNMDSSPPLPMPVFDIDEDRGDCDDHLEVWANETASAPGEARRAEASAFAQHAVNTLNSEGCEVTLP